MTGDNHIQLLQSLVIIMNVEQPTNTITLDSINHTSQVDYSKSSY